MILHLSPTCPSHFVSTCLPHLSPLGVLGRMILHLSPTLVSHSGCLGPHEFALLPLVFHTCDSGYLGPHEFTLVFHLSPTLGALGRIFYTCPPLVPHTLGGTHEFTLVFHLSPTLVFHSGCLILHLSPTLVSHTCLPLVGDKWKLMRSKAPRVGDKCGRRETSVRQVENKCKLMRPKAPRVGDKCGRQVWETSGRQV